MAEGRRHAETVRRPQQWGRAGALVLGSLVGVAAWLFLVGAAVRFGRSAQDGGGSGRWGLTVVAGTGAALCLLLVLLLVARLREQIIPPRPGRHAGSHRR